LGGFLRGVYITPLFNCRRAQHFVFSAGFFLPGGNPARLGGSPFYCFSPTGVLSSGPNIYPPLWCGRGCPPQTRLGFFPGPFSGHFGSQWVIPRALVPTFSQGFFLRGPGFTAWWLSMFVVTFLSRAFSGPPPPRKFIPKFSLSRIWIFRNSIRLISLSKNVFRFLVAHD